MKLNWLNVCYLYMILFSNIRFVSTFRTVSNSVNMGTGLKRSNTMIKAHQSSKKMTTKKVVSDKKLEQKLIQKKSVNEVTNGPYSVFNHLKKSPTKLLKSIQDLYLQKQFTEDMAVLAIRTFIKMKVELTNELSDTVSIWINTVTDNPDTKITTTLIKELCRLNKPDLAALVANKCKVFIKNDIYYDNDDSGNSKGHLSKESEPNTPISNMEIDHSNPTIYHILLLPELAVGFALSKGFSQSIAYLETMHFYGITIQLLPSKRIMEAFLKDADVYMIRKCLRLLVKMDGLTDQESVQLITNHFMKSIDFIKGAVSMDTLPEKVGPEIAFIGRSNVGKSSLINMICNRKGLAYTSKTPGKTSEFNYFDANGTVGAKKEDHQFYLVDLPGVGYAEVKYEKKRSWGTFFQEFVHERKSLRLLCHLIDSRHGFMDSDNQCLDMLTTLPPYVHYMVVLTKGDKRGGSMKAELMDQINMVLKQKLNKSPTASSLDDNHHSNTLSNRMFPIVATSSETKQGGAELWSVILDSVAGDRADELFYKYKRIKDQKYLPLSSSLLSYQQSNPVDIDHSLQNNRKDSTEEV